MTVTESGPRPEIDWEFWNKQFNAGGGGRGGGNNGNDGGRRDGNWRPDRPDDNRELFNKFQFGGAVVGITLAIPLSVLTTMEAGRLARHKISMVPGLQPPPGDIMYNSEIMGGYPEMATIMGPLVLMAFGGAAAGKKFENFRKRRRG